MGQERLQACPRGAACWWHSAGLSHLSDLQILQRLPAAQHQARSVRLLQLRKEVTAWLELPSGGMPL